MLNVPYLVKISYRSLAFKERTFITIGRGGFDICVDPINGRTDVMLYAERFRDKDVTDVMDVFLDKGAVFIDVGANIGYETLWGAKRVGSSGRVIAFEPVPRVASQLETSIRRNDFKNITLIRKGVGDICGSAKMSVNARDAGSSSITNINADGTRIDIETTTLDHALNQLDRIDLIKLDVEGYEPQVIRGASRILAAHAPPVVFEFQPCLHDGKYENMLQVLVQRHGYNLYLIGGPRPLRIKMEDADLLTKELREEKGLVNILAIQARSEPRYLAGSNSNV